MRVTFPSSTLLKNAPVGPACIIQGEMTVARRVGVINGAPKPPMRPTGIEDGLRSGCQKEEEESLCSCHSRRVNNFGTDSIAAHILADPAPLRGSAAARCTVARPSPSSPPMVPPVCGALSPRKARPASGREATRAVSRIPPEVRDKEANRVQSVKPGLSE